MSKRLKAGAHMKANLAMVRALALLVSKSTIKSRLKADKVVGVRTRPPSQWRTIWVKGCLVLKVGVGLQVRVIEMHPDRGSKGTRGGSMGVSK